MIIQLTPPRLPNGRGADPFRAGDIVGAWKFVGVGYVIIAVVTLSESRDFPFSHLPPSLPTSPLNSAAPCAGGLFISGMFRQKSPKALGASLLVAAFLAALSSWAPAASKEGALQLPIPPGQTWYVCQGYNGQATHAGVPALDLSAARESPGGKGCLAGTKYSSAGAVVSSPGAGIAHRWPGCCGNDFVCVDLDRGGSVAIGHLSNRAASGRRVAAGDRIGTVAWPGISNGDYAHIHVQAHSTPRCTQGSEGVAFDVAHGFKWACTPDLPYSGTVNQYSGLAVARCKGVRKDLSDDDGADHSRPVRQPVYPAVIRVFARFLECVTEGVSLAEAPVRLERPAVWTGIERLILCGYRMGLVADLFPNDLRTHLDGDADGPEIGVDHLHRGGSGT